MNKQRIAACVLIAVGTIGFGFWRWRGGGRAHTPHCVDVWDRSESTAIGPESVAASAKHALESPDLGKGSKVTVIATGDASSASEPVLVASFEVPVNGRVLEGRSAALDRREELLGDLKKKCETLPRTRSSPIYLAVKRGIEELRAQGCDADSKCVLHVQSDLEENANAQIKAALDGRSGASSALPAPINNDGITIVICGIAETVGVAKGSDGVTRRLSGNRDPQRDDRVVEVWRKLFTTPGNVTFQPYCRKD